VGSSARSVADDGFPDCSHRTQARHRRRRIRPNRPRSVLARPRFVTEIAQYPHPPVTRTLDHQSVHAAPVRCLPPPGASPAAGEPLARSVILCGAGRRDACRRAGQLSDGPRGRGVARCYQWRGRRLETPRGFRRWRATPQQIGQRRDRAPSRLPREDPLIASTFLEVMRSMKEVSCVPASSRMTSQPAAAAMSRISSSRTVLPLDHEDCKPMDDPPPVVDEVRRSRCLRLAARVEPGLCNRSATGHFGWDRRVIACARPQRVCGGRKLL